jgi:hypothetical protein
VQPRLDFAALLGGKRGERRSRERRRAGAGAATGAANVRLGNGVTSSSGSSRKPVESRSSSRCCRQWPTSKSIGGAIARPTARSNAENSLPERRVRRPVCACQLRSKTQRKNKKRYESDANTESGVPRADLGSGGLQHAANDGGTGTGLTTHEGNWKGRRVGTWKGRRVGTTWGEGGYWRSRGCQRRVLSRMSP